MSKYRKRIDDGRQLTIFDQIQELKSKKEDGSGSLRVKDDLQRALNDAIKECPLSRHQIVGEMSHLLNEEISKSMLDSWTAESRDDRHIPAEYLPAFCKVTGNFEALEVLNRKAGLFAMAGSEAVRSEIHKMREEARRLLREVRKREELLETFRGIER